MTKSAPHDDIALVGEYALRLLPEDEARAFEARLGQEPALRALLAEWEEGLVDMADGVEPVLPPPALKPALEARLFGKTKPRFGLKWLGAMAGVTAMLAVVFVNLPTGPSYTATIVAADQSLQLEAVYAEGALEITRALGAAREGRVLELWLIAANADAPVSLGVLPADTVARIALTEQLKAALENGTLAVSDEPLGGSPTGAPTGDVLAVGKVITS